MIRSCEQDGFATPQFLVAVGLSLALLASLSNVLVQQYGLAAVQSALDEGARAGGLVGADAADCRRRTEAAVRGLLGGAYRRGVQLSCTRGPSGVWVRARVRFPGWAPLVPDLITELHAEGVGEP